MTTLSKEEFKHLLANSVASPDLDKVQDAIADLVAENERLRATPPDQRQDLHCVVSDIAAECRELRDQLTATRTALAAARELLKELKDVLVVANQELASSGCSLDSEILEIEDFLKPEE